MPQSARQNLALQTMPQSARQSFARPSLQCEGVHAKALSTRPGHPCDEVHAKTPANPGSHAMECLPKLAPSSPASHAMECMPDLHPHTLPDMSCSKNKEKKAADKLTAHISSIKEITEEYDLSGHIFSGVLTRKLYFSGELTL
jgi:hypothetical protein